MNRLDVRIDDLKGPEVVALLRSHLEDMALHSPPESIHALDVDALRAPGVTFWSVWEGAELVGCGALKQLASDHAEIKSMRTAPAHRRKGVARQMLQHIINAAVERGYQRLSLETGSMDAFEPARKLYEHFGFSYCDPFDDYVLDPNSVFMTRTLGS